jgi:hypothetical protein
MRWLPRHDSVWWDGQARSAGPAVWTCGTFVVFPNAAPRLDVMAKGGRAATPESGSCATPLRGGARSAGPALRTCGFWRTWSADKSRNSRKRELRYLARTADPKGLGHPAVNGRRKPQLQKAGVALPCSSRSPDGSGPSGCERQAKAATPESGSCATLPEPRGQEWALSTVLIRVSRRL